MLANIRDRFLLALQYQDYRTLWIATTCSGAAAWALILARGWLAYDITDNNSLWVGIVTFGAMIPRLFSTPIFGFLADRFDRKTLLRWIFALNLAHNVLLALLAMQGWIGPWSLLFLSLFNGTLRAGEMTATTTLIPNMVHKEHLLNGIALNQATQQGSRLLGALAIAPLFGLVNVEAAFWLCSGFYVIGLIQISRITIDSRGVIDATQSFARNMVEGFVYVYQRPQILVMVMLVLAHCALTMSYESLLPAISEDKLGAGAVGISYMLAGVGAGALAASIFLAGIKSNATRGKLFLFFGVSSGLGPIGMAWSSVDTISIAAAVVMGANQAGFMAISHTIIQSLTEDKVRGRVAGVYSVHVGGSMAVTNLINAVFADMFNASAVMAVGGVLFIGVIVLSVWSGSLRRIYFPRVAMATSGAD